MIRFLPLEQRDNYDAILELYYYMVAMSMPFCPEDIYPTDTFHENGDIDMPEYPITQFYRVTGKQPRQRKQSYKLLLKNYKITELRKPLYPQEVRFKNDALLAKQIIKEAFDGVTKKNSLFHFLYDGVSGDSHVRHDRLHTLLTSYMDLGSRKQAGLIFKCNNNQNLNEVFRYDRFADKPEAVRLMEMLGVPVCPYCNRNFTTTVSKGKGIRQCQYDHYLSKSKYPWFALSLLNLIPACGYCNQTKGAKNKPVLYPYKEGMEIYYRFRTKPVHGIGYLRGAPASPDEFKVVGYEPIPTTPKHREHIENSLEVFHLEELYQNHQEFIASIFRQRYIFPDSYLLQLCNQFPDLFASVEEARNMLYLRKISPAHWGEHPLSKLTHDINKEIDELES